MIDVTGAVITKVATRVDRSITVTLDFGELVKLGDFDGLIQIPLRVILLTEEDNEKVKDNE
jgi:hypothetical protein